jgi:hypothetical protein
LPELESVGNRGDAIFVLLAAHVRKAGYETPQNIRAKGELIGINFS